mgnify:CR=1 FL=1
MLFQLLYLKQHPINSQFSPPANTQKWKDGHGGTDSLLLVLLAKMRSSVYGNLGAKLLLSVLVGVDA